MWGVIAGAASRAQNLASNVKSVLLDEQDSNTQDYDDSGVAVEYTRYNHGPFDQEDALEDAAFDGIGELPPVSSNAFDAVTPTDLHAVPRPAMFSVSSTTGAGSKGRTHNTNTNTSTGTISTQHSTAAATAVSAPAKAGRGYGSIIPPTTATPPTPPTTTSDTTQHYQDTDVLHHSITTDAATPSDGGVAVAGGSRRATAAAAAATSSPGVGTGLGVGRMLGTATTTMSFFTSASSVLQKVATHVAGAEEAADGAKQKPQVDILKQHLMEVTLENDGLVSEVARLKRALEDAEDSAELLQAQSQTAALLRNELTTEQKAHEATRRELDKLVAKLRQLEQQVESDAADVAQHDSFWKGELEQQRAAVAQTQTRNAELEALVDQLQQQAKNQQQVQHDTAAVAGATAAAAERITTLEAQLMASQAAAKEAERRVAVLEADMASVRQAAAA
ncbi:hypothetical protein VaNZ11_010641, partial [Volvox africanus]